MEALLRNTVLVMFVWLMLAGVCLGKQVYLKDGGVIECQSFWRHGDQVVVKINRDTVVDFQMNEIDARRTFRATGKNAHHARQIRTAGAVMPHGAAMPAVEATVVAPAPAPVVPQAPAAAPAVNPVPPPAPAPPPVLNETVQPEPGQTASADPSSPPDKAELERRSKEAADMMAEAIQKNDPELMKKAIELQKSVAPQNSARYAGIGRKIMLLSLFIALLIIVSQWVIFEKAGDSGWKSLIPIYNAYTLMEVSGCPGWWVVLLFIPVVNVVFFLLAMLSLAQKFGRGAAFGIGLWLLPMFFFPVLAFGGSQYEG
jgi:hypothetical protein